MPKIVRHGTVKSRMVLKLQRQNDLKMHYASKLPVRTEPLALMSLFPLRRFFRARIGLISHLLTHQNHETTQS